MMKLVLKCIALQRTLSQFSLNLWITQDYSTHEKFAIITIILMNMCTKRVESRRQRLERQVQTGLWNIPTGPSDNLHSTLLLHFLRHSGFLATLPGVKNQ